MVRLELERKEESTAAAATIATKKLALPRSRPPVHPRVFISRLLRWMSRCDNEEGMHDSARGNYKELGQRALSMEEADGPKDGGDGDGASLRT